MQFRNVRAEELEGSTDIPGLEEWLHGIGATDAAVLILAPPGTGKAAAVGKLAHRLGRDVLLCNLMELFDHDEPSRQLENLLRLCEAQRDAVIYFDKLDKAAERWSRDEKGAAFTEMLSQWLSGAKPRLLDDACTVVFTGRDAGGVPGGLKKAFDKTLAV